MNYIIVDFGDCDYGVPLEEACDRFVLVKNDKMSENITYVQETIEALFRAYSVIRMSDRFYMECDPNRSDYFTCSYLNLTNKVYFSDTIPDDVQDAQRGEAIIINTQDWSVSTTE